MITLQVDNLAPGMQYLVEITSENERGLSKPIYLSIAGGPAAPSGLGSPGERIINKHFF